MERDDVGLPQRVVQVVVAADAQDVHREARRAPRDRLADAAGADQRERRAVHVVAEPALRLPRAPLTAADGLVARHEVARRGEDQREREVGGGLGQHVGRDPDPDAAPHAELEVDVVGADGVVGDDAQPRRRVEQRRVDAVGEQRQQPLGLRRALAQHGRWRRQVTVPDVDGVQRAEALQGGAWQGAGDEDAGHG